MKAEVDAKALEGGIKRITDFVGLKTANSTWVEITFGKDFLQGYCEGERRGARFRVKALVPDGLQGSCVYLPLSEFQKRVSILAADSNSMKIWPWENRLYMTTSRHRLKMALLQEQISRRMLDDFEGDDAVSIEMASEVLSDYLKFVKTFHMSPLANPTLVSVHVKSVDTCVMFACTDGYLAGIAWYQPDTPVQEDFQMNMPLDVAKFFSRPRGEKLTLTIRPERCMIETNDDFACAFSLVSGKYPDIRKLLSFSGECWRIDARHLRDVASDGSSILAAEQGIRYVEALSGEDGSDRVLLDIRTQTDKIGDIALEVKPCGEGASDKADAETCIIPPVNPALLSRAAAAFSFVSDSLLLYPMEARIGMKSPDETHIGVIAGIRP